MLKTFLVNYLRKQQNNNEILFIQDKKEDNENDVILFFVAWFLNVYFNGSCGVQELLNSTVVIIIVTISISGTMLNSHVSTIP